MIDNVGTKMNCLEKGRRVYSENNMYMLSRLHMKTVCVAGNLNKYWHG